MTPETTTAVVTTVPVRTQVLSILFMIGAVRGSILLSKDAMKHKGFSKIIRRISAIIQLASILGSIYMMLVVFTGGLETGGNLLVATILIITVIGFISIITNIRGGILLFKEAKKHKGFNKWIRIVCGIIMIVTLLITLLLGA